MTKPYRTLVLIGKFQPVHNRHVEIIKRCTALTEQLIIVVGSAGSERTLENPFTFAERELMIKDVTRNLNLDVHIEEITDSPGNDRQWAERVKGCVSQYAVLGTRTGVIVMNTEKSSVYNELFTSWHFVPIGEFDHVGAESVRQLYFSLENSSPFLKGAVPQTTLDFLEKFKTCSDFHDLFNRRLGVRQAPEQVGPFFIGNWYTTQAGNSVQIVSVGSRVKGYETVVDHLGVHRYARSTHDRDQGRVTGTPADFSCADNIALFQQKNYRESDHSWPDWRLSKHELPPAGIEVIGGYFYVDQCLKDSPTVFNWGRCVAIPTDDPDFKDGKRWLTYGPSHNQITHWCYAPEQPKEEYENTANLQTD